MTIEIIEPTHTLYPDVLILGKQNAKTLGMFPEGAFRDHARKRMLYGAVEKNLLLGYILFRVTKSKGTICITHLCVKPEYRKSGIAKNLLDEVKIKYSGILRGISLSCRKDYIVASQFWEKYGFKALDTVRSRSIEERHLVKWWYDFGNVDLFSNTTQTSEKVSASLDANIIIKMSDQPCDDNIEAIALAADWLTEEVNYFYAPEIFNEINRDQDLTRATKTRQFIHTLQRAQFKPEICDGILKEISILFTGATDNHRSDRIQLAESIASGMEYFITLDAELLDLAESIFEKFALRILRPAEFILSIDQETNGRDYKSYRLTSPQYEYANIQQDEIDSLTDQCWLNQITFEKKHVLREKLIDIIVDLRKSVIRVVKNKERKHVAYFGILFKDSCLVVRLIRIVPDKLADILFQQLIRDIISISIERGLTETQVEDDIIGEEREKILTELGFIWNGKFWHKLNLTGQDLSQIILQTDPVLRNWDTATISKKLSLLEGSGKDLYKLSLEKKLWPVKFTDIEIAVYIIPIRSHWAAQLFDHFIAGISLFGAKAELSWSNENIYYRSVKPVSEIAPGRILWYVSSDTKSVSGRDKSIVATSYLEEVHVGEAKKLFNRFKNYGIYEWKDIFQLAQQNALNPIKALKFTDTEVFKKPVHLGTINSIMKQFGRSANTFASPVKVSKEIYNQIYSLGKK